MVGCVSGVCAFGGERNGYFRSCSCILGFCNDIFGGRQSQRLGAKKMMIFCGFFLSFFCHI